MWRLVERLIGHTNFYHDNEMYLWPGLGFCYSPLYAYAIVAVLAVVYVAVCIAVGLTARRWQSRSAWWWFLLAVALTPYVGLAALIAAGLKRGPLSGRP